MMELCIARKHYSNSCRSLLTHCTLVTHCYSPICIAVCTTLQHSTRYSDQSTGCRPTNRRATPGSGKHLSSAKCPVRPSSWPTQWLPRVRSRGKAASASAWPLSPSSADLMNEYNQTPIPSMPLRRSRSIFNTLRTGLFNCLNARSRGLNFRHRASCI